MIWDFGLYPVVILHFGVEPFAQHQRPFRIFVRGATARFAKVGQKVIRRDLVSVWHGSRRLDGRLSHFVFDWVDRRYVRLAGTAAEYLVGKTDRVLMSWMISFFLLAPSLWCAEW